MTWALFWMAVAVILFVAAAIALNRLSREPTQAEIERALELDEIYRQDRELQISSRG